MRRSKTVINLWTSVSRPITGSSSPFLAFSVKSSPNFFKIAISRLNCCFSEFFRKLFCSISSIPSAEFSFENKISKAFTSPSISAPVCRITTCNFKSFCFKIEKSRFFVPISLSSPEIKLAIFNAKTARSVKARTFGSAKSGILFEIGGFSTKKSYKSSNFKPYSYAKVAAEDSRFAKIPNKICSIPM